jgi:hypothetical protein
MNLNACIEEILNRGLDDWVHAAELVYVTISVGGAVTDAEIRDLSIEILRKVVKEGLMEVGDLTTQGFHAWNLPADEALDRIEREWNSLGRPPDIAEICWLSNTEEGDKRARQLPPRG